MVKLAHFNKLIKSEICTESLLVSKGTHSQEDVCEPALRVVGIPAVRQKSEYRWACMECGACVGQRDTEADLAHAASCSGQRPVIRVRVYESGLIDYPAMLIPAEVLISCHADATKENPQNEKD